MLKISQRNKKKTIDSLLFLLVLVALATIGFLGEKYKDQIHPPRIMHVASKVKKEEKKQELYNVEKIVDGDTIKIKIGDKTETVRLLQVDTPESVHKTKRKNVPLGKTATEFTTKFIGDKQVSLSFDVEKRDKYDRLLAYVYVDGVCLNEHLVSSGLARVVKYGKNELNYDAYKAIEKIAKESRIGIWKDGMNKNFPK